VVVVAGRSVHCTITPSIRHTLTLIFSDTTAISLANTIYYLAKHPGVLTKLQAQLDEVMRGGPEDWTYDKAKRVTYTDDIINESLRLRPAVMTGGYRVTPSRGLQVDEVFIPGDVNVCVPPQLIHTDERYYKAPNGFIPERWGERKVEMGTDEAPYYPFSMGESVLPILLGH
jgi:cytochrome P450